MQYLVDGDMLRYVLHYKTVRLTGGTKSMPHKGLQTVSSSGNLHTPTNGGSISARGDTGSMIANSNLTKHSVYFKRDEYLT